MKEFLKGFGLWLLCIPINFVPILIVYIKKIPYEEYSSWWCLIYDVIKDLDFLFVFVAVLMILPLQGLTADYSKKRYEIVGKACSIICYPYSVTLLFLYICCSLNSDAKKLYENINLIINMAALICTFIMGFIIHICISKKGKS